MTTVMAAHHLTEQSTPAPASLREGFTTGTAATAAALAAATILLDGLNGPNHPTAPHLADTPITTPLPPFANNGSPSAYLDIPILRCERLASHRAVAEVCKDGGDDPDATHNMIIAAEVCLFAGVRPGETVLTAGEGIGRVTRPGLPVPVGAAAINPMPRQQISMALASLAGARGYTGAFSVTISAPQGTRRARHTLNPRLGIVGGISILGTCGKVKPYSHEAWKEVIRQSANLAAAQGLPALGLATGRRSERLLMAAHPDWPEQAFIQMADFAAAAVRIAVASGFRRLSVGLFIGKLLKIAQGLEYTHARTAPLELTLAADWALKAGLAKPEAESLRACNTAMQALEIILRSPAKDAVLHEFVRRAASVLKGWGGKDLTVEVHLFDFVGDELYFLKT